MSFCLPSFFDLYFSFCLPPLFSLSHLLSIYLNLNLMPLFYLTPPFSALTFILASHLLLLCHLFSVSISLSTCYLFLVTSKPCGLHFSYGFSALFSLCLSYVFLTSHTFFYFPYISGLRYFLSSIFVPESHLFSATHPFLTSHSFLISHPFLASTNSYNWQNLDTL